MLAKNPNKKKLGRKSLGLSHKVTINFTEKEFTELKNIHQETGTPISTIIRRCLIKSKLLN